MASEMDRRNAGEPVIEPPQARDPGSNPMDVGRHSGAREPEISRATRPSDGVDTALLGVCGEWLRDRDGRPAGEELGAIRIDRTMVNVGTVRWPTSPALVGWTVLRLAHGR